MKGHGRLSLLLSIDIKPWKFAGVNNRGSKPESVIDTQQAAGSRQADLSTEQDDTVGALSERTIDEAARKRTTKTPTTFFVTYI
jgi:hypothetical protein